MFDRVVSSIGSFSYKYRKIICILAAVLFVVCIFLESQTMISYSYIEENTITEVFPQDDTLVIVYENKNEDDIHNIITELEKDEHITSIQAYSNTLGAKLTPADLAQNFGIDEMFVNVIYHMYYGNEVAPMTLVEFTTFITSDAFVNNPMLAGNIDEDSKEQLYQLGNIVNALNSNEPMSAEDIATMTAMDVNVIKTILFFTQFNTDSIVFKDFVSSINELTSIASGAIDEETLVQLNALNTMSEHITNKTLLLPGDIVTIFGSMAENEMFTEDSVTLLYMVAQSSGKMYEPVALYDIFMFLSGVLEDGMLSSFVDDEMKAQFTDAKTMIEDGKAQLMGPEYSRMIVTLSYKPDSDEIKTFYKDLDVLLNDNLRGDYYMVGATAMAHEVEGSFDTEYTIISIVTAIAVLIVVCISFRKFAIPVLLVCIIEFSVFAMMSVMAVINFPMYFIALILVQCILMGSMIDYAILLTTYYTEVRRELPVHQALPEVMRCATHSILTSSSILIAVSFICGFFMTGQVANILVTLGVGALCAVLLILFVLPACLTLFDRYLLREPEFVQSTELINLNSVER